MEFRNFLNKTFIKSYAQSDEVYADGFSYYKNGRVTHAVASKDKTVFQFTVKGNYNYKVTVRLGESLSCMPYETNEQPHAHPWKRLRHLHNRHQDYIVHHHIPVQLPCGTNELLLVHF